MRRVLSRVAPSLTVVATAFWVVRKQQQQRDEKRRNNAQRVQRPERLKDGKVRHLYHQTSPDNAESILRTRTMRPGSGGLAGGGIYFAETPDHTHHKAINRGVILEADVHLGRTKTVGACGDSSITYESLLDEGYDSVLIPRNGGVELVVYNPDQVTNVRVFKRLEVVKHVHAFNRKGRFACSVQPAGNVNF